MTKEEFLSWWAYHAARFTGVRSWLDKATSGAEAPSPAQIQEGWYSVLRDVDLDAAKKATDKMFSGEIGEPKYLERHPAVIRRAARDIMAIVGFSRRSSLRYVEGQETFRCKDCQDVGVVICWHPDAVRQLFATGKIGYRNSMAYLCHCEAARHCSNGMDRAVRYDPAKLPKLVGVLGSDVCDAALLDWAANYKKPNPENYAEEFGEFGGQQSEMEF